MDKTKIQKYKYARPRKVCDENEEEEEEEEEKYDWGP